MRWTDQVLGDLGRLDFELGIAEDRNNTEFVKIGEADEHEELEKHQLNTSSSPSLTNIRL